HAVLEPAGEFHVSAPRLRARWPVITMAIVALVFCGIREYAHNEAHSAIGSTSGPPPVAVGTATATQGDIGVYLTGLGAVTPVYTDTVHTRVAGPLLKGRQRTS